jgi:DNA-binding CsgD family transcriptional regulator/PAS domain-containing protein
LSAASSLSDREHLRAVTARLELVPADNTVSEPRAAPMWLVPELRTLLGAEHSLAYRPALDAHGGWIMTERATHLLDAKFERYHATTKLRGGTMFHYDPVHPEPSQRNQVRTADELCAGRSHEGHDCVRALWPKAGFGHWDQVRVLVCEGDTLLAWVGGFRDETNPFGARERAVLRALTQPLAKYLGAERRLRDAGLAKAGLGAALEAMGAPSFVVTAQGRVLHANRAGVELTNGWGRAASERLREVVARPADGAYVLRLAEQGAPEAFLVVLRGSGPALDVHLARLAVAWALTPREIDVLRRLVRGDSNKEIAAGLSRAEVTIERQLTALLRKSRCDSRARLVAHVWAGVGASDLPTAALVR